MTVFSRIIKGEYGYLRKKRNRVLLFTILSFAVSIALYVTGYVTTGTNKNLLTIVAVLGLLPASKSTVSLIMLFRARGCSEEARDAIEKESESLLSMYDMYFTTYDKNYAVSHMVVKDRVIIAYTEDPKCDTASCKEHIETMMQQSGHKVSAVTVTNDRDKYLSMLGNQKLAVESETPDKDEEIRITLYEITL